MKSFMLSTLVWILSVAAWPAHALSLTPGDLLVTDPAGGKVYKVDPGSGAVALVASGGMLGRPTDVVADTSGNLFVADRDCCGLAGAAVRIDAVTDAHSAFAPWVPAPPDPLAGPFTGATPLKIDRAPGGDLVIGGHTVGWPVVRVVDGISGATLSLEEGGALQLADVAITALGEPFWVSGEPPGEPQVILPDPLVAACITAVPMSAASSTAHPFIIGVVLLGVGCSPTPGTPSPILFLDPTTAAWSYLATSGPLARPDALAVDADGDLIALDGSSDTLIRIDLDTGSQSVIASLGFDASGLGIVPVPEPGTALLLVTGLLGLVGYRRGRSL